MVPKEVVQTQQDKTFDPLKKVAKFLNNFDNQEVATPSIREEQQVLENIVQSEALEQTSFEAEVVKEEPIEIEFLPDEPAEEKVEPVIVQTVEKQEDIKEQQLLKEETTVSETEENDISQSDIFNVQQSLEDLCKELGLIE